MNQENGQTALIVAVTDNNESYVELVSALLDRGADPNLTDLSGFNALYWAIDKNNFEAMDLLLPVTMSNLETTLEKLASNQVKFTAKLEHFIWSANYHTIQLNFL